MTVGELSSVQFLGILIAGCAVGTFLPMVLFRNAQRSWNELFWGDKILLVIRLGIFPAMFGVLALMMLFPALNDGSVAESPADATPIEIFTLTALAAAISTYVMRVYVKWYAALGDDPSVRDNVLFGLALLPLAAFCLWVVTTW